MDHRDRAAYSLRGIERAYGIDRRRLAAAIAEGELPAARLGLRRLVVLRADVDAWLRRHAVRPDAIEARVEQILAREGRPRPAA